MGIDVYFADFHGAQASIVRSLSGFEQQMRTLFRAISRVRMPPLCCMSTVPESTVVLQVPHMPCPQDDNGFRPAAYAASSTFSSSAHVKVRPLRTNSTEYVLASDPALCASWSRPSSVVARAENSFIVRSSKEKDSSW